MFSSVRRASWAASLYGRNASSQTCRAVFARCCLRLQERRGRSSDLKFRRFVEAFKKTRCCAYLSDAALNFVQEPVVAGFQDGTFKKFAVFELHNSHKNKTRTIWGTSTKWSLGGLMSCEAFELVSGQLIVSPTKHLFTSTMAMRQSMQLLIDG